MSAYVPRSEDLLNQHIDSLLHGDQATASDAAESLPPEMEEMLAVAGLLAGTLGAGTPAPEARATGLQQFLTAARKPPAARILLFPTMMHRDGVLPLTGGKTARTERP